jgi:hypothetical protein
MADKERHLINERLVNLQPNERLFRINAGSGWAGKIVKKEGKFLILANAAQLHAAPTGWGDLCGWTTVTVTPEMVGKEIAVFTMEEVKATGKLSAAQKRFRNIILRMGGIHRVLKP